MELDEADDVVAEDVLLLVLLGGSEAGDPPELEGVLHLRGLS